MDSDDSDFYGDEETVSHLQQRVDRFKVRNWSKQQKVHRGRAQKSTGVTMADTLSQLHNPLSECLFAWQLTETVDDFVRRLPPETTDRTEEIPWIYVCNPYIRRVHYSERSELGTGNEFEAPDEIGGEPDLVTRGGLERLEFVSRFIADSRMSRKSKPFIEWELDKCKKDAVKDILQLAWHSRVRAGKWMLFCRASEVNEIWSIVATATANNELGIAAKVSPREEKGEHLLCVYTADFQDKADVGRVLRKLRELKLVQSMGRPIFYKPDAFTRIGIASGNPWGLKASIYSSTDSFPR